MQGRGQSQHMATHCVRHVVRGMTVTYQAPARDGSDESSVEESAQQPVHHRAMAPAAFTVHLVSLLALLSKQRVSCPLTNCAAFPLGFASFLAELLSPPMINGLDSQRAADK